MRGKPFSGGFKSRYGGSTIGSIVMYLVIASIILAIYLFVPPYYHNWKLGSMFKSIATKSSAMVEVSEVAQYAIDELSKQGYTFAAEDLHITKNDKKTRISVDYDVPVMLPGTEIGLVLSFHKEGGN